MNTQEKIVNLTVEELDKLVYSAAYQASRRAKNELFKGLQPILVKNNDDLEEIHKEIRYMNMDGYDVEDEE